MAKIKRWLIRLRCILTGGCEYAANELLFTYFPSYGFTEAQYEISNHCVKCGKRFRGEIPAEKIDKLLLFALSQEKKRRSEDG